MKKNLLPLCTLFLFLVSCKKDKIIEPTTVTFIWPAGTSDYAPHTLGSTFTFESATGTPVVIDSFTYTVVKDTTINALPFKKLTSNKPVLGPTYFANTTNGVVTNISYNVNLQGFTVPVITQTILKDNVIVNTTWSETQNITAQGFTVPVTFTYTLMQNNFTKMILGKDYNNSIYVKQIASIPAQIAALLGIAASNQVDNYFAKGVGLTERTGAGSTVKIKRYTIVK